MTGTKRKNREDRATRAWAMCGLGDNGDNEDMIFDNDNKASKESKDGDVTVDHTIRGLSVRAVGTDNTAVATIRALDQSQGGGVNANNTLTALLIQVTVGTPANVMAQLAALTSASVEQRGGTGKAMGKSDSHHAGNPGPRLKGDHPGAQIDQAGADAPGG